MQYDEVLEAVQYCAELETGSEAVRALGNPGSAGATSSC
jgi:hypothetical protein